MRRTSTQHNAYTYPPTTTPQQTPSVRAHTHAQQQRTPMLGGGGISIGLDMSAGEPLFDNSNAQLQTLSTKVDGAGRCCPFCAMFATQIYAISAMILRYTI
jgi:hypothetical protein